MRSELSGQALSQSALDSYSAHAAELQQRAADFHESRLRQGEQIGTATPKLFAVAAELNDAQLKNARRLAAILDRLGPAKVGPFEEPVGNAQTAPLLTQMMRARDMAKTVAAMLYKLEALI